MKQTILPKPDALLQIAFYRARKKAESGSQERNRFRAEKAKALEKMRVASAVLEQKLESAVKEFPSIEKMHPFARELLEATIETGKTKKALGQFSAALHIIKKVRREQSKKVFSVRKNQGKRIHEATKQFFGRVSSVIKSLGESIEVFNEALHKMNELPSIDFKAPTIVLAGFPNTGKTTILSRLTGSKAKIASYAFTTQKLELGYFEEHYAKIQVIDTPGLLDRPLEKRSKIEQKAIAAIKHLAKIVVFVIDPTEHCGYPLKAQLGLLEEIKKQFRSASIIATVNKTDIATKEQIEKTQEKARKIAGEIVLEGTEKQGTLREKIAEKIGGI